MGFFNRILGIAVGFINATIITLLLSLLVSLPFINNGKQIKEESLFKYVNVITNKALVSLSDYIDIDSLSNNIEGLDINHARD